MANEADLKLIQIPEFPKTDTLVGSGPEYVVLTKADGVTYGMLTEDFKSFLGTVQVQVPRAISPTDPAPTLSGIYRPTVSGTYANLGGLVIDTNGKLNEVIYDGTTFVNVVTELPEPDLSGLVEKNSIVNDLITGGEDVPLSAEQGAVLNSMISDISVIAENKINNGDLGAGQTGWLFGGQIQPSIDTGISLINNNSIKISASGQSSIAYQDVVIPDGHIIYYATHYRVQSWSVGSFLFGSSDLGTHNNRLQVAIEPTPLNQWRRLSATRTVPVGGVRISVGAGSTITSVVNFDGLILIDLTEVFGAGNEPAKEEFEAQYLSKYSDFWFNGITSLVSIGDTVEIISGVRADVAKKVDAKAFKALDVFSKEDILKYPALSLFKSLSFILQSEVLTVSLIQLYVSGSTLNIIFNINSVKDGSNWRQSISITADVSLNPTEVTVENKAAFTPFGLSSVSLVFDYSGYNSTMAINNANATVDNRIFIKQDYVNNLTLKTGTLNRVISEELKDRRALLGTLPFSKYDYRENEFLSLIKSIELTNIQNGLEVISITSISKINENTIQMILNENDTTNGSVWAQQIIINVDVSANPETIIFEGQKPSNPNARVKITFDYSSWNDRMAVNRQTVALNDKIDVNREYIRKLKEGDEEGNGYSFSTLKALIAATTSVGSYGFVGDLKYKRIAAGSTEASFKRCFHYMVPEQPKFTVADIASGFSRNVVDIDKQGRIRAFGTDGNLYYYEDFEALKSNSFTVLANLVELNPLWSGVARSFVQLEDNKLLIVNPSVGDTVGGLWVLDMNNDTLEKTLTFRNKYIEATLQRWSFDIKNKTILYSEYGNSLTNPPGIGQKADATKIWKSIDNGITWTELYDFKNMPNIVPTGFHIHSVHHDMNWNRIWVTSGDVADIDGVNSSKRLSWSDNGGVTFNSLNLALYFGSEFNALNNAQGLSMFSTNDFLLMGGDDYNNGIYRVAKLDKNSTPVLELVYKFNPTYNDRVTQFTTNWLRLKNGLIVVGIGNGDTAPRRTRILGTYDGYKWYELWTAIETSEATPANDCILTEHEGYLYMQFRGSLVEGEPQAFHFIKLEIPNMV